MVSVNKNIVPGKQTESSAKPTMPARRPRNTALNSSKKLPDSIKNRRKQKLNCSREQVIDQLVNEEQIYTQEEAEELINSFEEQTGATVERLATVEEVEEKDGEFWATKDGRTTLWCRGNGMWYDSGISDEGDALDSSACSDSTANDESLNSSDESAADTSLDKALEFLNAGNVPEIQNARVFDNDGQIMVLYPDSETGKYMLMEATVTGEPTSGDKVMEDYQKSTGSLDSSKGNESLNSSADGETNLDDIKITTESGNEVSMQDIKIVQNPDTNELAIFIPEDEEETIPEGFSVIGMVVPDMVDSDPAIEGGDVCPECGQDPCVCEDEELDSSCNPAQKGTREKLNSASDGGFEQYFDRVTDQELADYYGIPVKDITDTNDDIERASYGKVVGHYIPKDEYADVLVDNDWDTLDILEDGTVGFSLGEGGGKATRFYGVDIDSIKEAIADAGLDSSRGLNSAKRPARLKKRNLGRR